MVLRFGLDDNSDMNTTRAFVGGVFVVLALTLLCGATAVAGDGGPVERRLHNGSRAVLWPRPGSGTVLITVAVPAGSHDEPAQMAGLSHYLEHLLFDGFDLLDERGVTEAFEQRSAYVNAFTREQATIFFALSPVVEARATAELLVGMLTRSKIVPETFEKERKVILEELAKDEANPESVKEEMLRGLLWGETPLGRPVGGVQETVAATDHETVKAYWKKRYQPGSWRILITGDQPLEELEKILEVIAPLAAGQPLPDRNVDGEKSLSRSDSRQVSTAPQRPLRWRPTRQSWMPGHC